MLHDKELWESLPEDLKPLHIEYKKIEFLAWTSIDYDALSKQKGKAKQRRSKNLKKYPDLQLPSWPEKILGLPPDTEEKERIFGDIIAIDSTNRISID